MTSGSQKAPCKPQANLLQVSAVLALLYYAWIMFDLVTHPMNLGSNGAENPYLFRWLSALCGTISVVVAVFILRRLPGNLNAYLLLIFGVGVAGWSLRIDFTPQQSLELVVTVFSFYFFFFSLPALSALMFHFPSGRIFPARWSGLAWVLIAAQSLGGLLSILGEPSFQSGLIPNVFFVEALQPYAAPLNFFAVLIPPLAGVGSLVLRFRAGGARERLQIKWLAWLGSIAVLISLAGSFLYPAVITGPENSGPPETFSIIAYLYWQVFPAAAIGIALLRYRLWDIDLIIRRTLQYSLLMILLGLAYLAGMLGLQQVFRTLTGQESDLAVVLSTLLIAILFEPARHRVQEVIERRFYRQKYDAMRALEGFSNSARREMVLDHLEADLVRVVQQTVQPALVSVWIRDLKKKSPEEL